MLTKRMANTPYAGYWEFPGGKIELGESPAQAVRREAREELGVEIDVHAELPVVTHTYEHATVQLHALVCTLAQHSPPARDLHVAAHRWCALNALPWEHLLPANVRLVTALVRWLEEH